jgi:hypothetical protein
MSNPKKSYFLELRNPSFWVKILKFFDADPGSGMEKIRIRDPGWKKVGSGMQGRTTACNSKIQEAKANNKISMTKSNG